LNCCGHSTGSEKRPLQFSEVKAMLTPCYQKAGIEFYSQVQIFLSTLEVDLFVFSNGVLRSPFSFGDSIFSCPLFHG
jgi:hypothetical protein